MGEGPKPWRATPDGLLLTVRVTPNAGADRIEGIELRADGQAVLRLRVTAVPDRGRANVAVAALLADALGLPKSAVSLVSGTTARIKTLRIAGHPGHLAAMLDDLGRST